ncbi:uncharacterized protein LOC122062621 [Macadamia integrifolia]|uniref:uncharacterized protein LOC122062621 n=1 Tax=Macadamia integrifolia TaxID=60698 RepID=UPI001C4F1192|nr:uncharacterized protein LOC122062621 [Macadamia integrifolia]
MKKAIAKLALSNILKEKIPEIICIAEPMVDVTAFPKLFFTRLGFDIDFIHNNRSDKVPNLWLMWKRNIRRPNIVSATDQHITISLEWHKKIIRVSVVHANCFRARRRDLWASLAASAPAQTTPWLVVGDFNTILASTEKRGPGAFNLGATAEFGAMVDSCDLMALPSQGSRFTWTNNRRRGNVLARLDRSFCNNAWVEFFHEGVQQVLQKIGSDHAPIFISSVPGEKPNNCPFRFHRHWVEHKDFLSVVSASWSGWTLSTNLYRVAEKLKRLKGTLKLWAKTEFPNFNIELDQAKKEMEEVQKKIDEDGLDDFLFAQEADAKTRYFKAMEYYEKMWAEKSRIRWKKLGDRCTKFFHLSAKMRRIKNSIRCLKTNDGAIISERSDLEHYMVDFFTNFHKAAPVSGHPLILDCIPRELLQRDRDILDRIPSDLEIKEAVWSLDPASSPGPDGFPGEFFKHCWDIIAYDVCNAIRCFFISGIMPQGINNNFLLLIPKTEGADSLDKFRPLCMGNFICKIISKTLAMRLASFLPRIISREQGAFQRGKIIHTNIYLASELANMMSTATRGGGMGVKIDIKKAFDTIDWSFLFSVMRKFGFSETWIGWVHQLLDSAKISILLNGGPVGYFNVGRGLRQGDPLSPLLFVLAEEVLCRGLNMLIREKKIKPLNGPRGMPTPSHMLFADDIFIFINASIRYVKNLKSFLIMYEECSGQHISLEKSKVFLGNISAARKLIIGETMGIPICSLPTKYLGVEIFKGRVKKEFLLPVMDKVKARLAGWKGRLLSMAGRVELARTVVTSIPMHSFSVYWWPSELIKIMEKWIRNFIWTGDVDTCRSIIVSWDQCCKPKSEGGLGLRRLREINEALLSKAVWKTKHDDDPTYRFLKARFTKADGSLRKGYRSSSIWMGFRKLWEFVSLNERWIIGNGRKINFLNDRWLGPKTIAELLETEQNSDEAFSGKVDRVIQNCKWNFPNCQSSTMSEIINSIMEIPLPQSDFEDRCVWSPNTDGIFSTKSAWNTIRRKKDSISWEALIWSKKLQPRISIFAWRIMHGKLPTDAAVMKRGIPMASRCDLCRSSSEDLDHILVHCQYAERVWNIVCEWFNIPNRKHESLHALASWWKRKMKIVNLKEVWSIAFAISAENIWKERNGRRFEERQRQQRHVIEMIKNDIRETIPNVKTSIKSMNEILCCRRLGLNILSAGIKPPLEVYWCKPLTGWVKLNFDGSSIGNHGNAGAGAIMRDHNGRCLWSCSIYLGIRENYEAELEGLMHGLMKAKQLAIPFLWVESDSAALVMSIHQGKIPWMAMQRWNHLRQFLGSITWKITHNYREGNSVANFLAKKAAKSRCSTVNDAFPGHIYDMMARDESSRPSYRFR